jgi:hypothetical protein
VVDEAHRSYYEGDNPLDTDRLPWRYYGEHRHCQRMGKNKNVAGFTKGISMWSPHCVSAVVLRNADDRRVLCKVYRSENLPSELMIIEDRKYIISVNGNNVEFTHYLLTPNGAYTAEQIQQAFLAIVAAECGLAGGGLTDPNTTIDFESFESAAGMERAAQDSLEFMVRDPACSISVDVRLDAMVLCGWLGSFDGSIDEIFGLSPWAGNFILGAMLTYKPPISSSATILMDHSGAVESLTFQQQQSVTVRKRAVSADLTEKAKSVFKGLVSIVKSSRHRRDSLVFTFPDPYDEVVADNYQRRALNFLSACCVDVFKSTKLRGSIILKFEIDPIPKQQFYELVQFIELQDKGVTGLGLAVDGEADKLDEVTDTYSINFDVWVTLHSVVAPVVVKDSEYPLQVAVYCRSITKSGICCRNKTKDPSRLCWRHRN